MRLLIGENIKRFRREKELTQEELAEVLGVSYQSVSRWENNLCYPDMELLPAIAEFFGTTVDKLLGMSNAIKEKNVKRYLDDFQFAISRGDVAECIRIARAGVAEYPNDYILLNKLMYALFIAGDEDGNIPEWKENMQIYDAEITSLGERIMKYCPDQNIRLDATARLAFNHCEMGRKEVGRAIYETLPSQEYCKEAQIWWGLNDDEKLPFLRNKIRQDYESLKSYMWILAKSGYIPDESAVCIFNKIFDLDTVISDGNLLVNDWEITSIHCDIAKIYARLKDAENLYKHLKIAADAAKCFDQRPEEQTITSLVLGDIRTKKSDFETSDSRSLCEIMRDKWLAASDFDAFRETDTFHEIVTKLDELCDK